MITKSSRSGNFRGILLYVLEKEGAELLARHNLETSVALEIAATMTVTASQSRTKTPVYHLMVSWDPADQVSRQQMREAADRLLKALGLTEHQAVVARHTDQAHPHVHIVVNRVHLDHGQVREDGSKVTLWTGWKDYEQREGVLRELEHGWRQVEGDHARVPRPPPRPPVEVEDPDRHCGGDSWRDEEEARRLREQDRETEQILALIAEARKEELPMTKRQLYGCRAGAKKGNALQQYRLGRAYEMGLGVKADVGRAQEWFARSAAGGHAPAHEAAKRCERYLAAFRAPEPAPHLPVGPRPTEEPDPFHAPHDRKRKDRERRGLRKSSLHRRGRGGDDGELER